MTSPDPLTDDPAVPPPIVINGSHEPAPSPRRRGLLILTVAFIVFLIQLTVLADTGSRGAAAVVDDFVEAFNRGDATAVDELLVSDPSMLSWPAGPPWGGVLQWTLELLPDDRPARLTHSAELEDYVSFHRTLTGSLVVERCGPEYLDEDDARIWLDCRFVMSNELSRLLDPSSPEARGVVRFAVIGDRIDAVLVESWDRPAPSGVGLLLAMRADQPADFGRLFGDRVTVAEYRATTAQALLAFATEERSLGT